jgi:hypothetical protein
MRGLDGRVVAMRFDVVDPEILKVASTRPEDSIAELEEAARECVEGPQRVTRAALRSNSIILSG